MTLSCVVSKTSAAPTFHAVGVAWKLAPLSGNVYNSTSCDEGIIGWYRHSSVADWSRIKLSARTAVRWREVAAVPA